MSLPRDLSGDELATLLRRHYDYRFVRQRGSHITMGLDVQGARRRVLIPRHRSLRVGTLSDILSDVAAQNGITSEQVRRDLFGR